MPNVGRLLKAHNQKVLKQHQGDSTDQDSATCNCRNKTNCSLSGKCQVKSIVYQANVLSEDGASYSYTGLSKSVGQIIVKALRTRPTELGNYIGILGSTNNTRMVSVEFVDNLKNLKNFAFRICANFRRTQQLLFYSD